MNKGKVLLVEDNEVNQLIAGAMLEHSQLDFTVASNGKEAITKWRELQPDIIFMDCQMPFMDGYEATRQIRSQEQKPSRVPIIALTANAMQGDREKCFAAGMDDYLTKPFKEENLHNILNKWLTKAASNNARTDGAIGERHMRGITDYLHKQVITNLQQFLNEDKMHALLSRYIADSAGILQQLHSALTSANQEEARRLVHSLKSTSANVGAMPLSELAKTLEDLARGGQLSEISARMDSLNDCFTQTQMAIDALEIMRKHKTG